MRRENLKAALVPVWAVLLCAALVPAARAHGRNASAPMRALQHSSWIPEGSPHPHHLLYVFMDANCPYCHKLWVALAPYYRSGLQVRDILVGVISPSSPGKAAAIFDAADPSAALRRNEALWGHGPDHRGGIAPVAHPSAKDLRRLARNEALMQAFGFQGTPGLVFADSAGKVYALGGLPPRRALGRIVAAARAPPHAGQPARAP